MPTTPPTQTRKPMLTTSGLMAVGFVLTPVLAFALIWASVKLGSSHRAGEMAEQDAWKESMEAARRTNSAQAPEGIA